MMTHSGSFVTRTYGGESYVVYNSDGSVKTTCKPSNCAACRHAEHVRKTWQGRLMTDDNQEVQWLG